MSRSRIRRAASATSVAAANTAVAVAVAVAAAAVAAAAVADPSVRRCMAALTSAPFTATSQWRMRCPSELSGATYGGRAEPSWAELNWASEI